MHEISERKIFPLNYHYTNHELSLTEIRASTLQTSTELDYNIPITRELQYKSTKGVANQRAGGGGGGGGGFREL